MSSRTNVRIIRLVGVLTLQIRTFVIDVEETSTRSAGRFVVGGTVLRRLDLLRLLGVDEFAEPVTLRWSLNYNSSISLYRFRKVIITTKRKSTIVHSGNVTLHSD